MTRPRIPKINPHRPGIFLLLLFGAVALLAVVWYAPGTLAFSERANPGVEFTRIQNGHTAASTTDGICGDQNNDGAIDVSDAIIDLQIIVGLIEPTEEQQRLSDVVPDGEINVFDLTLMLQHIVGLTEITACGGPFVSNPVTPGQLDLDLRTLPVAEAWKPGDPVRVGPGQPEPEGDAPLEPEGDAPLEPEGVGAVAQNVALTAPIVNFDGISNSLCVEEQGLPAGSLPPDTVGAVGPNHYIQMVNTCFAIYSKQGNLLSGPSPINALWADFGGPCEDNNHGDPDVKYDHLADRWVVTQFVAFTNQCFAVSRTPDPVGGGWFLYDFPTEGVVNDYPKIGVWPDAYYMGSQRGYPSGGSDAWAFDRLNMLRGNPATYVRIFDSGVFMLPSDLDGSNLPLDDAPNVFARVIDGAQFGGVDRIELREFRVDFDSPANSTFINLPDLATAAFDSNLCGFNLKARCIRQPGSDELLTSLTAWLMSRLQYRNFGTHETLVVNHTVDVNGNNRAGVHWYELRRTGNSWSIFQQGTHSPDSTDRWMGSVAMDKDGNMALGYSVSSNDVDVPVFPGIRYTGRLASDPVGSMPLGEATIVNGGGAQTHSSGRWGDYSAMTVDPVDDCTFWFTTEYYQTTSQAGWQTRIAAFKLPGCGGGIGSILAAQGELTLLRVHDVGTKFGPPQDQIDVEVVIRLDTEPGKAFGFQLRDDVNEAARRGMLDLLRDAFNSDRTVRIDYVRTGLNTGIILRVWYP